LGAPPREPWALPPPVRGAVAAWLRLRYRLLPFLYTLAEEAHRTGLPPVRPLAWPLPGGSADTVDELWDVDDQILLGTELLVAPVTAPGLSHRTVLLPRPGWVPVWADAPDPAPLAPGVVDLDTPLERAGLLARRGAVIPLDDAWAAPGCCRLLGDGENEDLVVPDARLDPGHQVRRLAFHCWPDRDGSAEGTSYDDDGDGWGPSRRDRLRLIPGPGDATLLLVWETTGSRPPPPTVRLAIHGADAEHASADGRPLARWRRGRTLLLDLPAGGRVRLDGLRIDATR
jgi:alpha-glucosidase